MSAWVDQWTHAAQCIPGGTNQRCRMMGRASLRRQVPSHLDWETPHQHHLRPRLQPRSALWRAASGNVGRNEPAGFSRRATCTQDMGTQRRPGIVGAHLRTRTTRRTHQQRRDPAQHAHHRNACWRTAPSHARRTLVGDTSGSAAASTTQCTASAWRPPAPQIHQERPDQVLHNPRLGECASSVEDPTWYPCVRSSRPRDVLNSPPR